MHKGFTLIELLITVAIFVFMTALILANYTAFNAGTLLTNLAFDTALTVRQAQTYGVSVRAADSGSNFDFPYGVAFSTTGNSFCSGAAPQGSSFVLFADSDGSGNYNKCDGSETVSTYNLKQRAKVSALCVSANGNNCVSVSSLYITFKRPDPSAVICSNLEGNTCPATSPYILANITLMSSDGATRVVVVRQNGQISVGN